MKTLIKNVRILTMDASFTCYELGYLVIKDDTFINIGAMTDLGADHYDHIIDGKGAIALPGMINAHTHIGMIPFRSLGDDTPDRLTRFLFPLENACMTEQLAYQSGKYAIAEMQLAGITTFCDMYYFEEALAQATDEMGSRAILAETVLETSPDTDYPYDGLKIAEAFVPKYLNHSLITPAIAPHAPYTNTEESLSQAAALSSKYNIPLSIHLSEMTFEMDKYQNEYGKTPIAYLADLGILNSRVLAAHCIFATPTDIQILKKMDVAVAHCIGANTKSAKGIAPIQAMLDAGIRVGLGTDGPSSGNTLDLFTQMRMLANFHKTHLKNRAAFPARDIVRLATMGGAEALGMSHQIGSIEVGKKADLVLIETESVNMFPIFDPYAALVYSAHAGNVQDVFINGEQVVANKTLTQANLGELRASLDTEMIDFRKEVAARKE
ncbi:amidohydrolase [Jeotgalibaca dankookensis]|uniref:amidohydrolase n=1 Tax=Jeotgalibaca dankookensis TaxID=708126 RepID=UPI000783F767|nr:amidohydrolase [Jeotgalibaca dankookensis]